MLSNYLKLAMRNLLRQRGYALINILGLSVGLTVSLLMLLWVQDERNKDQFHTDSDRIYRVLANVTEGDTGIDTWEDTPYPLVEYLQTNFPEVETIGAYDPTNKKEFSLDGKKYLEDGIFATPGFFEVFSFPIIEGKRREAFNTPNAVLLSESLATKLFGNDWKGQVVGEKIAINEQPIYTVTGVYKDVPQSSSLEFDFVLNLDEQHEQGQNGYPWGNYDSKIVLKLKTASSKEGFSKKIVDAIQKNNQYDDDTELMLQAYNRQYLHQRFENGVEAGGRIEYVRLFGIAAFFLILIACINFMNLSTARATRRAKEVGVRKTIGAGRGALILQFMTEAVVLTGISVLIALFLCKSTLPYFKDISGKELILDFSSSAFWILIVGISVVTALLAGSYPAFFLSSFKTINVLKGKLSYNFGGSNIRRGLVVVQFALSALLIVSALVVHQQVNFIKNKHLGLDKENVMYFRTPSGADDERRETYKNELARIPGIEKITFASTNPLSNNNQTGDPQWEGMQPGDGNLFSIMLTDDNFLSTLNIPLSIGRDFSADLSTDTMNFLINETAAKVMNMEEPLGKRLKFWGVGGPIIGVVKDFHINSLHESIGPLIIANVPSETRLTLMRIDPNRTEDIIAATESVFQQFNTGFPFRYDFLDQRFLQKYQSEVRTSKLSRWFALVALFISCLGLFGLSAFIAEQKAKEIGIRKVLGASISSITFQLSRQFLGLVILSLVIALPLSWYLMAGWLEDFAYRINLSPGTFALAGVMAIVVAISTVGYQSIRAAMVNPVESLKNE